MQLTREGSELRHGGRLIIACRTPQMAQYIATMLDAVARLDGVESGARDERQETIAIIQAVMALRALEKEATRL
jgi:hypothetical protein